MHKTSIYFLLLLLLYVILTYETLPFLLLLVLIVFFILTNPLNYNNKFCIFYIYHTPEDGYLVETYSVVCFTIKTQLVANKGSWIIFRDDY
jgi:hypothetical protein